MMLGWRKRKAAVQTWCAAEVDVAGCFRERVQTGACHSGRDRLHNVGQITRRLSAVKLYMRVQSL